MCEVLIRITTGLYVFRKQHALNTLLAYMLEKTHV